MRNRINEVSKKAGLLGLFLASVLFVNAQSNTENPAWTVSKDVQRVANKKMFEDKELRATHIQVKPISPTWMISKGVHRTSQNEVATSGNIKSKGTPAWTISKGVQRIGRE